MRKTLLHHRRWLTNSCLLLLGFTCIGVLACRPNLAGAAVGKPAPGASSPTPAPVADQPIGFAAQNGGTTGGQAGRTVTATTLEELTRYAKSDEPLIIRIDRTISGGAQGAEVSVKPDKTLLGVGAAGFLEGVGLHLSNTRNVVIRNLKFTMSTVTNTYINDENRPQVAVNDGDCVSILGTSRNIWIDHCEFYNLDPIRQPNQDLYDGLVDVKDASAYITISWCYFHDHHKCHLIGSSAKDDHDRKMTFHHNYYYNITERAPSYRFGTAHVFNNYYRHVYYSGVNSRMGACLRVENNYFEDDRDPIISKNSPVPGQWNVRGNLFNGSTGSQPTTSTCSFAPPYAYSLDKANEVKRKVMQGAGVGKL